jgi:hypothetical protein
MYRTLACASPGLVHIPYSAERLLSIPTRPSRGYKDRSPGSRGWRWCGGAVVRWCGGAMVRRSGEVAKWRSGEGARSKAEINARIDF